MTYTAKKMGTTNSAPVFDRSVDPPLFLGVVAIDIHLDALEQVLGEDARSSTMLQRFVLFRLRSAPKFIFRNVSLMLFATSQEGKKQHAEDATPLNTPALFPPNAL